MDKISNEVEIKKEARKQEQIDKLRKQGKTMEEINGLLPKEKKKEDVVLCKTATDVQKRKLDRLMKDVNKEVYIPEPRKEWKPRDPAEFVRHVMGSSAGAGSGEFHVYRGIRRREFKRQEYLDKRALKDELDDAYHDKVEENKQRADELTAKKRAKRQKRKQRKNQAKKAKKAADALKKGADESDVSEDEEDEADEREEEEEHFVIQRNN